MDTDNGLAAALRRARDAAGMTIRELAAATGLSTGTVVRYESGPVVVRPKTLLRLASALDVTAEQVAPGEWMISPKSDQSAPGDASERRTVLTDGSSLLTLRVPAGFLESLSVEQRAELEADALLEVLRLAQAARRRSNDDVKETRRDDGSPGRAAR